MNPTTKIPTFLYGTAWKEDKTSQLVVEAVNAGFRGIDTACQRKHYNEAGVGSGLQKIYSSTPITRNDLFLQTKFTFLAGQDHRLPYNPDAPFAEQVAQSFAQSLTNLQTHYIDSYVLHGPSHYPGLAEEDYQTWQAMEELQKSGKTRYLGVSNVDLQQLKLLVTAAEIKPTFVQNRCFARTSWDRDIRRFCKLNDITYQGFSLLTANRRELANPVVAIMADNHGKSIAQLIFRFATQIGILPLTGTTNRENMQKDLAIEDFQLSESEVKQLTNIGL
jgi:diketogulonate reductase-like aldo/keto reductase